MIYKISTCVCELWHEISVTSEIGYAERCIDYNSWIP